MIELDGGKLNLLRESRILKSILSKMLLTVFPKIKNMKIKTYILRVIMKLDNVGLKTSRELMKKNYNIIIGNYSYGCFKLDYSIEPGTTIGSFCSIAPGARIGSMNHPYRFISTHPFLYDKSFSFVTENNKEVINDGAKSVVIEDDVWVGLNAIVLPGVTIGRGAIVGAGSVVTKNVPPYSIVAGSPAKIIKKRFSEEQIKLLLEINWASWEDDIIKRELSSFYDVDEFINRFKGLKL